MIDLAVTLALMVLVGKVMDVIIKLEDAVMIVMMAVMMAMMTTSTFMILIDLTCPLWLPCSYKQFFCHAFLWLAGY